MKESVYEQVRQTALKAKAASESLALIDAEQRNRAMRAMAQALRQDEEAILEANARDMEAGRASGMTEALLDRLELTAPRIQAMACALEDLANLPDPVGRVIEERTITCDLLLRKQSCPLGVVAMVYEARPNVTVDAAGICLKTANACVLRGGSQALHSNLALVASMRRAAAESGIPQDAICAIDTADRSATDALASLHGIVDVLIPRGGAGLIRHCVDNAKVPVIETGTGNCHIYIHRTADLTRALNILVNAKTQRTGVCNACESVLIDRECADRVLPALVATLAQCGVLIHGDDACQHACQQAGLAEGAQYTAATPQDWGREYLAKEISVRLVEDCQEAIAHINRFGTHHSECIVCDETISRGLAPLKRSLLG